MSAGMELCDCERGHFDPDEYQTCYTCYLERRAEYVECIFCERWHSPRYDTCYRCRRVADRDEAGRNLKYDILIRDGFTCQNCGSRDSLHVDHIEPCVKGGTAVPWNLQALCSSCNRDKGSDYDWRWEQRRFTLMHLYFTFGWKFLNDGERDLLVADARECGDEFVWHARFQKRIAMSGGVLS